MSFGRAIAQARKKVGLSQKELASRILKEDGTSISPQYLNDIEHDRRNPPSEELRNQLADELDLPRDYLHFLAGTIPEKDLEKYPSPTPEQAEAAFQAFRKAMGERQE
jgi:transcriptional regulator with XRE-family HTH domain